MGESLITSETRGTVACITLDRAAKKNALTRAMYDELVSALHAADAAREVRSVLLTGAGGTFTAGNDLGDFMDHPPTSSDAPVVRFLTTLIDFAKPVVAAVDGLAVGVGTTLLLHCDHVIATDRARFHMPFTRLGLVPEAASSLLLPALVGRQRATEWLLLGRPFDASQALAAGIVNRVVPPDELAAAAAAVGAELAALPTEAVLLTKRLLREGTRAAVDATLRAELAVFVERLRSPEALAALTAFKTRR